MNCFNIPNQCFELIMDFASINWKKRFTLNVLPYIKSVLTVACVNGKPCVGCYNIEDMVLEYECKYHRHHHPSQTAEMTFDEFVDKSPFYKQLSKKIRLNGFANYKHWAKRFDGFDLMKLHITEEVLGRAYVHSMGRIHELNDFRKRGFVRDPAEIRRDMIRLTILQNRIEYTI